ncbi:hypothetical protein G9465_22565 (plasmid) [Haloarcula sp. JP-L23]|nr:hypothetical protein G9465_22565 [Haloarcula sp. JP-L23]
MLDEDSDDENHDKREDVAEDGWIVDEDVCTDGGTDVGFCDVSQPQPYDNSRRFW